nr:hypothetical protein [Tanacetum cinerariifolium]
MREGSALPRILWKNLIGGATKAFRSRVADGVSTRDTLGVVIGTLKTHTARRESWWLSEEVQAVVAVKQARFRKLLSCREAHAKEKAYEDLYKKLDTKEGANDIFRIAKARERRRRDLRDICFIKVEEGRTITDEEEIKKRWREYFSSLFNTREWEGYEEGVGPSSQPHPECYYSRISQAGAVRPNQIPIEAWRSLGDEGIFWLTSLFNKIFNSAKMPEERRLSEVITIFKNKGDAQVCSNYRGINFLGHTMKLWERVIERRLRRETSVSENQFGFMLGRSSVEAIHLIRSLIEKYRERLRDLHMAFLDLEKAERLRDLHMAFLDLEKAYDSVLRELICKTLVDKGTSRRYIKGSEISPYLFALILDELSREIQEDIPWCLIFADDIVLVSESAKGLNIRLENWREYLEDNGLRISREKIEYVRCDFSNGEITNNEEVDVCIGDKILQPKESFWYLRSMLHKYGRIDEDVSNRIKAAWMKWRAATGVLCDRKVPLKVEVAELRMLRWTCGETLLEMIPNGVYSGKLEVETIINKMREGRLRWFGHVRRRPQLAPVRRVEALVVDGLRRRGGPKLRWEDRVKHDMKELFLSEDMTSDRNEWRARIRCLCVFVVSHAHMLLWLVLVCFCGFACPYAAVAGPLGLFRLVCSALVANCLCALCVFCPIDLCLASHLCGMFSFRVCLLVIALLAPIEAIRQLHQELVADVELANNLLHELNWYLDQLLTRSPELLWVEALPDDPLIKYGFSALEKGEFFWYDKLKQCGGS